MWDPRTIQAMSFSRDGTLTSQRNGLNALWQFTFLTHALERLAGPVIERTKPPIKRYNVRAIVALKITMVQIMEIAVDRHPVGSFPKDDPIKSTVPKGWLKGGPLHEIEHVNGM